MQFIRKIKLNHINNIYDDLGDAGNMLASIICNDFIVVYSVSDISFRVLGNTQYEVLIILNGVVYYDSIYFLKITRMYNITELETDQLIFNFFEKNGNEITQIRRC